VSAARRRVDVGDFTAPHIGVRRAATFRHAAAPPVPQPSASPKTAKAGTPVEDDDKTRPEVSVSVSAPRLAPPRGGAKGDTIYMGAIDKNGLAVSFIQSIYWEFGSGCVLPATGVLMQNRGASFSLDPKALNALELGRRPFHTLNPALAALKDGRVMAYGAMGGDGQPQTQGAVFTRYVVFRQPLERALDAPRWLLGRTWGSEHTNLRMESRFDGNLIDRLMAAGHDVAVLDEPYSDTMGHAGAVVLHADGTLEGGHDPRADGGAAGV